MRYAGLSEDNFSLSPETPMTLNDSILETVTTYKYLGLLMSSNLLWSDHIQSVCSKARKILGLLYCRYNKFSDQAPLLQLYLPLVCSCIGSPGHLHRDIQLLERTQSLSLGCSPRPGMQAMWRYYVLRSSLLYQPDYME